jgi:septum formation protein
MILGKDVVLASGSPRRQWLLLELVEDFEIFVPDVDEDALTTEDPVATAETLAKAKALAVLKHRPDGFIVGGDTVVALPEDDGTFIQLSKPKTKRDAEKMLSLLSGKTHLVITGVCLAWDDQVRVFSETSKVTFRKLDPAEIKAYVATGEPMDKAGAYASQGGAEKFIENLEGSKTNVVGLPLERVKAEFAVIEG